MRGGGGKGALLDRCQLTHPGLNFFTSSRLCVFSEISFTTHKTILIFYQHAEKSHIEIDSRSGFGESKLIISSTHTLSLSHISLLLLLRFIRLPDLFVFSVNCRLILSLHQMMMVMWI